MSKIAHEWRYIEFKSYSEMAERATFQETIGRQPPPVDVLIGFYRRLDPIVQCGLCRKEHRKGYLVLFKGTIETNVGHCCGRRLLGTEFTVLINQLRQSERIRDYKMTIAATLEENAKIRERIAGLKTEAHGANWLNKSFDAFMLTYPQSVLSELRKRAQRNDTKITAERQWTPDEIELFSPGAARDNKPRYVAETVGDIRGLAVFSESVRKILVDEIERKLAQLKGLYSNRPELSESKLRQWAKWCDGLELLFLEARRLIAAGQVFFAEDNLKQLGLLSIPEADIQDLRLLKWDYENARAIDRRKRRKEGGQCV